jgi:transposase
VHELPPPKLLVTEWQAMACVCPGCGEVTQAALPNGVVPGAQYGSRMKALMVYLSALQLIPSERTTQILGDLLGVAVSEGTLAGALARCGGRLAEVTEAIKQSIHDAAVAGFDETGARVAGRLMWLHTASTASLTHLAIDAKRGGQAHERIGILPTFAGVAVHDGYDSYRPYRCRHQLCNAHHLRELTAIHETTGQAWASQMADLLREIWHHCKTHGPPTPRRNAAFRRRYDELVRQGRGANLFDLSQRSARRRGRRKRTPAQNLLLRLAEHRDDVLRFMTDPAIPFDNNQSERDLRMMKVKQKVSGCFRTVEGAQLFCDIRSYIATIRKQGGDVLQALTSVFDGSPIMPVLAAPPE